MLFNRKRFGIVFLILLLLQGCSNGGDVSKVQIDYGQSSIYSREDMDSAIQKIKEEFKTWKGAKLLSVSYTDDKRAEEELSYCNELKDGADFSECIVFESVFHSPKKDSGAWNPDQDYTGWQWYLARSGKEDWELLTWGY